MRRVEHDGGRRSARAGAEYAELRGVLRAEGDLFEAARGAARERRVDARCVRRREGIRIARERVAERREHRTRHARVLVVEALHNSARAGGQRC